jgi:uncharacterized protein (TIGR02118 family)
MIRIVGYWTAPKDEDIERFERDYLHNHVTIAGRLPGLRRLSTMRVLDAWQGSTLPAYRVVEADFDSREAMDEALKTPEFHAMRKDRQRLIDTYGVNNHAVITEIDE